MGTRALTNRMSSGRWLVLLTASALAHGAAVFVMPTVSIAPVSINADDALSVTLLQISPAAVEQRHPAKQPLTEAVVQSSVRPTIVTTPGETTTSPLRDVEMVAVATPDNTLSDSARAPQRAQQTRTIVAQTPPEPRRDPSTARSAKTRPIEVTPALSAPIVSAPVMPNPVTVELVTPANETAALRHSVEEAFDDGSDNEFTNESIDELGDEFEDDDSAPYAESADPGADVPVDLAVDGFVHTPAGETEREPIPAPEMTLTSANTQRFEAIVPTPAFAPRSARTSDIGIETALNESAIRSEIRARFDHDLVYPPLARKRGWEGNVDVMLRVSRHGSIEVLKVVESSGFGILDRYTRKTLEHIRLDDQFLQGLQGSHRDLRIEVQYQLIASRG